MIQPNEYYRLSDIVKNEPSMRRLFWDEKFKRVSTKIYWLLESGQIKSVSYKSRTGKNIYRVKGQDVLDFLNKT
jgi:hypothetical protein